MITLDGSYGEGGGALVRVALALSTFTGQPFEVKNIRANRPEGGLKAQHLTAIKALQQCCEAKTSDVQLGSTEFWYHPGKMKKGIFEIDIGTAGSISLVLQALTLPALFAPGKVTFRIKGGTCGKWQASVDYIQNVLFPQLQRFVDKIELKVIKRGYFPKGGGDVQIEIQPRFTGLAELPLKVVPIRLLEREQVEQIRGIINLSQELQDQEVGERIKKAAEEGLHDVAPISIRIEYVQSQSIGGEIVLWAICSNKSTVDYDNPIIIGSDALIEKNKRSEEIGKEVAQKLKNFLQSENAVDDHLADQLIPFMALLSESSITAAASNHLKTNMYVAEKFLPVKFQIEENRISVRSF